MSNLNKALAAYVEIRQTYFGGTPTNLSLDDLQIVLINKYDELPLRDVALVLQLVKTDHQTLQASRNARREPSLSAYSAVQNRQTGFVQRGYKASTIN